MNVDLHCHSTASDGVLAPDILAERAKVKGVDVIALTDHDELRALPVMRRAVEDLGLRFIDGVEVSCEWEGTGVHIVGLGFDPDNEMLSGNLASIRDSRETRARRMADSLADAGIEGAYEGALAYAGNPSLLSRAHFARHLASEGHASSMKSVFQRFLSPGLPGFVEHVWPTLADAVAWIRGAGGVAVIAHPGRYDFDAARIRLFLGAFVELGGQGIEVSSGAHTPDQYGEFAVLAREFGLLGSRGSDFHAPGEGKSDLGRGLPLPAGVEPVWHCLLERKS